MNWDEIKGNWTMVSGQLKSKWGKLTDDDFKQIDGKREELAGRLQKQYGHTKEEAEKNIDEFLKSI